jgi:hypothetical protein
MDWLKLLRAHWERSLAVAVAVAGVVLLIVGWWGVSGASLPAEQLPYLVSCGLAGLFALGVAATLWLSADLRDEWRTLNDIKRALDPPDD